VSAAAVYRCRLCRYRSDKVTVVRHHVMSHLLYHPYRCPYCDAVRSVKSSPINKHIRLRHPGQEPSFICERSEELERSAASQSSSSGSQCCESFNTDVTVAIWVIKHPVPDRVRQSLVIFDIRAH